MRSKELFRAKAPSSRQKHLQTTASQGITMLATSSPLSGFGVSGSLETDEPDLAELDAYFWLAGAPRIADASWVSEAEVTLTIGGATLNVLFGRKHAEKIWEGDAEFVLHINGKGFKTERA